MDPTRWGESSRTWGQSPPSAPSSPPRCQLLSPELQKAPLERFPSLLALLAAGRFASSVCWLACGARPSPAAQISLAPASFAGLWLLETSLTFNNASCLRKPLARPFLRSLLHQDKLLIKLRAGIPRCLSALKLRPGLKTHSGCQRSATGGSKIRTESGSGAGPGSCGKFGAEPGRAEEGGELWRAAGGGNGPVSAGTPSATSLQIINNEQCVQKPA